MNFYEEVIESSEERPVVVDFWAPWCGPCQYLGPVIEELATQSDGKWTLVKLNTDEYPEISRQYGIQGIPAVKMFYNGEVIAEFVGALPRHQIERWLEQNLPDARTKEFAEIIGKINDDEVPDLSDLEKFVGDNQDFLEGRIELARRMVFQRPQDAAKLVKDIKPGNKFYSQAEDIVAIHALVSCSFNENQDLAEKLKSSQEAIRTGNLEQALEALIQAVMIDKEYCDQLPRKSVIAIFNLLGPDHNLTRKYRRQFDMALY